MTMEKVITAEQIAKYRTELADNSNAIEDLDLIERCDGDLEYSAIRLAKRAGISEVREGKETLWQIAIREARKIVCRDGVKDDLAPNILGGLYGLLIVSSNPILVVVATPMAIYITKETLKEFCKSSSDN